MEGLGPLSYPSCQKSRRSWKSSAPLRHPFVFSLFSLPPKGKMSYFSPIFQVKEVYVAGAWCDRIAHVKMASTISYKPLALLKGVFLICGDWVWPGIPSHLTGDPCTLGRLGLFTPNKIQIMDWQQKNYTKNSAVRKRDLACLDPDCSLEIIHRSRAKATAVMVFLPLVSVAKSMGKIGRLECWVARQVNLTSNALADLLSDEEITRQMTLESRAAID